MWRRPWRFGILGCTMVGKLRPPPLTFLGTPNRHQSLLRLLEFLRPFGNGLLWPSRLNRPEPFGWGTGEINAPREEGLIGRRESFEMCSLAHERHYSHKQNLSFAPGVIAVPRP